MSRRSKRLFSLKPSKPSFLLQSPSNFTAFEETQQPVRFSRTTIVPWMEIFTGNSRDLLLYRAGIRAKRRNEPISTRKDPRKVLKTAKKAELVRKYDKMRRKNLVKTAESGFSMRSASLSGRFSSESQLSRDFSPKFTLIRTKNPEIRLEDTAETDTLCRFQPNLEGFKAVSRGLKVIRFDSTIIPQSKQRKPTLEDVKRFVEAREVHRFRF